MQFVSYAITDMCIDPPINVDNIQNIIFMIYSYIINLIHVEKKIHEKIYDFELHISLIDL